MTYKLGRSKCKPNKHKTMVICECELERIIKEQVEKQKNACVPSEKGV